jgi:hypothetical protein
MPDVVGRIGASKELAVVVRGGRETDFKVARKPEKVVVTITKDDKSTLKGRYRVTVGVPPGTDPGEVAGDIVLRTDHPHAAEVIIPVSILISRSGAG